MAQQRCGASAGPRRRCRPVWRRRPCGPQKGVEAVCEARRGAAAPVSCGQGWVHTERKACVRARSHMHVRVQALRDARGAWRRLRAQGGRPQPRHGLRGGDGSRINSLRKAGRGERGHKGKGEAPARRSARGASGRALRIAFGRGDEGSVRGEAAAWGSVRSCGQARRSARSPRAPSPRPPLKKNMHGCGQEMRIGCGIRTFAGGQENAAPSSS